MAKGRTPRYLSLGWRDVCPSQWFLRKCLARSSSTARDAKDFIDLYNGVVEADCERAGVAPTPSEPLSFSSGAYYAVAAGRVPGIYTSGAEALAQVNGFLRISFKKFSADLREAQTCISSPASAS